MNTDRKKKQSSLDFDNKAVKQLDENIKTVLEFYAREDQSMSFSMRILNHVCNYIDQPIFIFIVLLLVSLWILLNVLLLAYGFRQFDPPPFHYLQGIIGLCGLLTATIVLSKQNRLTRLEEQRAHLDLKVNLITEQKVAKLIDLLEQLRLDLPNVKSRVDAEADILRESIKPDQAVAALDERGEIM